MTRGEVIHKITEQMEDLNPAAAGVESDLLDQDISPHNRLINYDALTTKLERFAAELERMRQWVR